MSRREDADMEGLRTRLLEERAALEAQSHASKEDRRPVALDQQSVGRLSRMDAMQVQAMALAAEDRRALRRRHIEAALRRFEEGEYGFCVSCGEPIARKRLEVDPAIPRCIACAG